MEKQYIAPSLTVVAIHVERGYADSIISASSVNDGDTQFLYELSKTSNGCKGTTESRGGSNTSSNWTTSNEEGFWGDSGF